MDYRTRNRPFSYLRPRPQMPNPLLERALFPNTSRTPESNGTRLQDQEQGPEQEEDTAEEHSDPVPIVEGGRRAAGVTGPSSSTPASRSPTFYAAQARNKDKRQPASLGSPAANRGSAHFAKRGARAANGRGGSNRTLLANYAAASNNAGPKGTLTKGAGPGTPSSATSSRERPGLRATTTDVAAGSGRFTGDRTPRQLSRSMDQDNWAPFHGLQLDVHDHGGIGRTLRDI
ncbi:hypothetical protein MRX96_004626 [Rhipicephalus microplus]